MKLLKCHIENFGKLSNVDFDFDGRLNTFKRENGWGKTTLSEFLCAMFYGLPDKSTRKKYQPWQGGNYGGYAEFELSDGNRYRVERYFKKSATKATPDDFRLIDMQTNTDSDRFSENLGFELFEINASGYMRSAFINKKKLYDDADEKLSDSNGAGCVSARLGGLLEDADDIGSYDGAIAALDKKRRHLIAGRGDGGQIDIKEAELADIERDIESAKSLLESAKRGEEQIAGMDAEIEALESTEKELEGKQKLSGLCELARQYKNDCQTLEKEQRNIEEYSEFFKGKVPEKSETDEFSRLINDVQQEKDKLAGAQMSQADTERIKLLSEKNLGNKSSEELKDVILKLEFADRSLNEYTIPQEKSDRLAELKNSFPNGAPDNKTVAELNNAYDSYRTALTYMTFANERLEDEKKNAAAAEEQNNILNQKVNSKYKKLTVLSECASGFGIAMTVIGFMIGIPALWIFGIALIAAGFAGAVVFDSKKVQNSSTVSEKLDECEKKYKEKINECIALKTRMDGILERLGQNTDGIDYKRTIDDITYNAAEIEKISDELKKIDEKREQIFASCDDCRDILVPIFGDIPNSRFRTEFENALKERTELENLCEKQKNISEQAKESEEKIKQYELKLNDYFAYWYNLGENPDCYALLRDLNSRIDTLNALNGRVSIYSERCREILEKNPEISEFDIESDGSCSDNAESNLQTIREQLKAKRESRLNLASRIDGMYNSAANLPELESRGDGLRELIDSYKKQYKAIENAMKYLEEAKNNLSVRYLRQMNRGFAEYMSRLSDTASAVFRVDKNFNVKFDEVGKEREAKSLSDGWRDLVGFCTRLSLVKALFPNEKPFLIVDDPFANLDNRRLAVGKQMLSELSEEYQIIYFTCADERA